MCQQKILWLYHFPNTPSHLDLVLIFPYMWYLLPYKLCLFAIFLPCFIYPSAKMEVHEGRVFSVFNSLIYPKHPEPCLGHSNHFISIC